MGGTELTKKWLFEHVDVDLLSRVNIVSRPDDMRQDKPNVLWVHDLPADMPFLASRAAKNQFSGIVFVSSWQQTVFFMNLGVKYSESTVIRNAIVPITATEKPDDGVIRLIYHPTPHRGLEILVPVFVELCKKYDNLHLDVFSNFDIYGRSEANQPYEHLYEACRSHPNITYHGSQPNDVVRDALAKSHIFAYPCIWRETSCISAMEAMSAGCLIVAPDYCALPETLANFNVRYSWSELADEHAERFSDSLESAINSLRKRDTQARLEEQKAYADSHYGWEARKGQWEQYLTELASRIDGVKTVKKRGLQWN